MTRISRQPLSKKMHAQLFKQLAKLFSDTKQNSIEQFFSELLTESEQIMFVKRLAIVLMLSKGQSTYRIAQLLHVSDSTVRLIRAQYEAGKFNEVIHFSQQNEFDSDKFWKTIEVLLRGGMPSYGKDRWKGFGFHD